MILPLDSYQKELNKTGLSRLLSTVYKFFINKYMSRSAMPWTDRPVLKYRSFFVGRVYLFDYDPIMKDVLDFYDKRPISLILSQRDLPEKNSVLFVGLNLHYIPGAMRVWILNLYYGMYRSVFDAEEKLMKNNKKYIPATLFSQNFDLSESFRTTLRMILGRKYEIAIRAYRIEKATNIRMIEMEDWYKIGFVVPNKLIGISPKEIQENWNKK